jgi:MFS family permease
LYPVLLNNVIERAPGFAWAVRAVAFMDLGLLVVANLIMRTRLPPKKKQENGDSLAKEVLTDVPYMIFSLGTFLVFWGVFVPFFYLQLYTNLHHVDARFTKYVITIMNAASVFGRTVPNFLADLYGPLNVMIVSSLLSAGLIFALFGATTVGGAIAFAICYGFFSGGVVSLATPAASRFVTHSDLSDVGIRIGILSFCLAFAVLTGNPIAGAVLAPPEYRWHQTLIFAAVVVFAGAVCHILVWTHLSRRKGTKLV